jgi:hypothetical protein
MAAAHMAAAAAIMDALYYGDTPDVMMAAAANAAMAHFGPALPEGAHLSPDAVQAFTQAWGGGAGAPGEAMQAAMYGVQQAIMRPFGPEGMVGPEGMQYGPEGMPLGTEGMPLGTEGMPLGTEGMELDPEGMPLGTKGMQLDPEGMQLDPEGMPYGGEHQGMVAYGGEHQGMVAYGGEHQGMVAYGGEQQGMAYGGEHQGMAEPPLPQHADPPPGAGGDRQIEADDGRRQGNRAVEEGTSGDTSTTVTDQIIVGDSDPNLLTGGDGDDTISGLGGSDILTGGNGADIFRYISPTDGGAVSSTPITAAAAGVNGDRIEDFVSGVDEFNFLNAAFGFSSTTGPLAEAKFFTVSNYNGENSGANQNTGAHFVFDSNPNVRTLYFDLTTASDGYTVVATVQSGSSVVVGDIVIVSS